MFVCNISHVGDLAVCLLAGLCMLVCVCVCVCVCVSAYACLVIIENGGIFFWQQEFLSGQGVDELQLWSMCGVFVQEWLGKIWANL